MFGWLSHSFLVKTNTINSREQDTRFILIIVSIAFLMSIISDVVLTKTNTSPLMYGLMGGIVEYYFYKDKKEKKRKK